MTPRRMLNILNIVRELDLDEINEEAERRFQLLVAGHSDSDALGLAQHLSGGSEIHPWIDVITTLPPEDPVTRYTSALLVTSRAALDEDEQATRTALAAAGVPVIVVQLGTPPAGEAVPRSQETARVRLTSVSNEREIRTILAPVLFVSHPDLVIALARQLEGLRPAVAEYLITETANANAGYAFSTGLAEMVPVLNIPLNLADVVILTKNQLLMAYKLALALGKQGRPRELMGEIVGVLGGGLLFRQIARQLVGLVPGLGIPAKTAVAYAGTQVIGRAVYAWGTEGVRMEREELKALMQEAATEGRAVAQGLIKRGQKRLMDRAS